MHRVAMPSTHIHRSLAGVPGACTASASLKYRTSAERLAGTSCRRGTRVLGPQGAQDQYSLHLLEGTIIHPARGAEVRHGPDNVERVGP